MKRFVVFDSEDKILRWGFCANRDIQLQKQEGAGVIEVEEVKNNFDLEHRIIKINGKNVVEKVERI